jgi:alpha-glucosidase (family GH31 glycosyl hydrolase)
MAQKQDLDHWTKMGDFQFDPACWPAPDEMFAQLKEMNVQCMVSMWPYVVEDSRNLVGFDAASAFMRQDEGKPNHFTIFNGDKAGLYDPFRPEAKRLYWQQAKGYFDQGATIGWMDSCEPDDGLNVDDFKESGISMPGYPAGTAGVFCLRSPGRLPKNDWRRQNGVHPQFDGWERWWWTASASTVPPGQGGCSC